METITRSSVAQRESFLRSQWKPGKKFWELGEEAYLKSEKALKLLVELQNRYPDEKDFETKPVNITWEVVTENGKYGLD
ncbi:hypothetical protein CMT52_11270 [Elizabethkingia anophelis]|nr:hypothetical protein [Elizabethkingia anophelis]